MRSAAAWAYRLAWEVLLPLGLVFQLVRCWRNRAYGVRWWQRFGFWPKRAVASPWVWLHAVSVGEVRAALPIVQALATACPQLEVIVSTTTPTGAATWFAACRSWSAHRYMPLDAYSVMTRVLKRTRPQAVIVMERELWPNLIWACESAGIPLLIANARLSERSRDRYRQLPANWLRELLRSASIAAQTQADAERFVSLGADPDKLRTTGNTKLDAELALAQKPERHAGVPERADKTWLAASTHADEELAVLMAHRELLRRGVVDRLVLVPRHPERAVELVSLIQQQGFSCQAHTASSTAAAGMAEVLLVDVLGVLRDYYPGVGCAFVGGSLTPKGGHSLYEPLFAGTPVVVGPHTENVADVLSLALASGAAIQVQEAQQLVDAVSEVMMQLAVFRAGVDACLVRLKDSNGAAPAVAAWILELVAQRSRVLASA